MLTRTTLTTIFDPNVFISLAVWVCDNEMRTIQINGNGNNGYFKGANCIRCFNVSTFLKNNLKTFETMHVSLPFVLKAGMNYLVDNIFLSLSISND